MAAPRTKNPVSGFDFSKNRDYGFLIPVIEMHGSTDLARIELMGDVCFKINQLLGGHRYLFRVLSPGVPGKIPFFFQFGKVSLKVDFSIIRLRIVENNLRTKSVDLKRDF